MGLYSIRVRVHRVLYDQVDHRKNKKTWKTVLQPQTSFHEVELVEIKKSPFICN